LLSQGQAFSDLGAALENAVLKDACPALCGIGATDTLGRLSDARRKSREVSSTSSLVMKQLWALHTHASLLESGAEAALAEAQATWKVLSDTKTKFREMAQGQVYGPFSETILDIVRPAEERLEMLALGPLTTMVAAVRELCSPSLASALDGQRRKLLVLLEGLIGAKEVSKLDISDIRESSTVYKIDSVINNPIDSKTGVNSHRNRSVIGTRSGSIRGSSSSVDMTEGATSSSVGIAGSDGKSSNNLLDPTGRAGTRDVGSGAVISLPANPPEVSPAELEAPAENRLAAELEELSMTSSQGTHADLRSASADMLASMGPSDMGPIAGTGSNVSSGPSETARFESGPGSDMCGVSCDTLFVPSAWAKKPAAESKEPTKQYDV